MSVGEERSEMRGMVDQEDIEDFVNKVRAQSDPTQTTFLLFVNCELHQIEVENRTPGDLKSAGISMRNLQGEFIK